MIKIFGRNIHWAAIATVILVALTVVTIVLIPQSRAPESAHLATPAYWPTLGWRSSTAEEQGFDSAKLADGLLAIQQKNLNIHSLLVVRNGSVILDAYFYPYDGKTYHDMASVSKSVTTALIGIAANQGKLRLDDTLVSFFTERTIANRDARKERLTIRHLASMTNGMDSMCFANDEGTLTDMVLSPDWVQFALDRKMTSEPGTYFCYDSPGMHLLSAILQKATGMTEVEYARQNLFEPLGIKDVMWPTDPQGYTHGWSDLHLYPRDAAKIGYLWLNMGQWDGKQIVPRDWVENSVKVQIKTGESDDYGYGWWIMKGADNPEKSAAIGRGGQRIGIYPTFNLVLVVTGGGLEPSDATDLLAAAVVNLNEPLPANPAGVAKLNAALATVAQQPAHKAVGTLPEMAKIVSGKTWEFESNPIQLQTMRLEFNESDEAYTQLTFASSERPRAGAIGLDGVYRMSPGSYGLPAGIRGNWADAYTFVMEYDEIANHNAYTLQMRFTDDRVSLDVRERSHESGFTVRGTLQNP